MNLQEKSLFFVLFCFGRQRNKIISTPTHKLIIMPYILLWELFLSSTHFLKTHPSEFTNPDCRKTLSFLIDRWYKNARDWVKATHQTLIICTWCFKVQNSTSSIWLINPLKRRKKSPSTSKEKNPKFSLSLKQL